MAKKDDREIVHGIRVMVPPPEGRRIPQSKTFASGMEDELATHFDQQQLDTMKERGDLTGNWKSLKKTEGARSDARGETARGEGGRFESRAEGGRTESGKGEGSKSEGGNQGTKDKAK